MASFVGSQACATCHPDAFQAWSGSHHDRALDHATAETVLGDFSDAAFSDPSIEVQFKRDDDGFHVRTRAADGEFRDFRVAYVMGFDPLQQYLIALPNGRLQALTVAWDTERERWFALENEAAPPGDWLHWTGGAFNANSMCIPCHATQVDIGYDADRRAYETTWSEIDVGCEACHGAGSLHVTWAKMLETGNPLATSPNQGLLVSLTPAAPTDRDRAAQQREIDVCARCHSRRRSVHPGDRIDLPFHDAYLPELLHPDLYYPDGQILGEVYVHGSFLQSRMAAEGVRCSHCHDPHSGELRAEGNALCTQCHDSSYDSPVHTHHPVNSSASLCVECHMRPRTYMGIDARRDHGFHLPRPDWSVRAGVPNACNACHADRSANWAQDAIVEWYGPLRPEDQHGTEARLAAIQNSPDALQQLLSSATDPGSSAIVRATAVQLLSQNPGRGVEDALVRALADPSPLVRATAIDSLDGAPPEAIRRLLTPLLRDPSRAVRSQAARALSALPEAMSPAANPNFGSEFQRALGEYRAGQQALADQPGAQLNLAVLAAREGRVDAAEQAYLEALRLDPLFLPARFNLAMLYDSRGRTGEAEKQLRAAVHDAPELADAHYSLGLLLAADPARGEAAAAALSQAARLAPSRARVHYNAGLAHQRLERWSEAESLLLHALSLEPENPEVEKAVVILYLQQQRHRDALPHARRLIALRPEDPSARALLLRAEAGPTRR